MNGIEIYKALSQPPKTALREIKDGKLKGKSDINPQWRYEAMTKQFGLVGIGWKYEIQNLWKEPGAGNEMLAFAQVAVYIRDPETKKWSDPIVGIGGSKLINDFNRGSQSNDEGYKMAVTDAFSTSLKMIGVAADVYAGRWDGSKYKEPEESADNEPAHQTNNQEPAGGPDTPEQHAKIKELLATKSPSGVEIFAKVRSKVGQWRMERTADQVIKYLEEEKAKLINEATPEPFPEDIPYDESPLSAEEEAAASTAFETN